MSIKKSHLTYISLVVFALAILAIIFGLMSMKQLEQTYEYTAYKKARTRAQMLGQPIPPPPEGFYENIK